jgi:N-acetylglucosaminyldiphosphoundecaprenol N-acetyl-beta-D-mannosaminyltransferase
VANIGTAKTINILDINIHTTNLHHSVQTILQWIQKKEQHYVCVRDVHGIVLSQHDPLLKRIHQNSGLTVPDGMPLVWIGRLLGFKSMNRVYGPDLMAYLCELSVEKGLTHCLYGGKTEQDVQTLKCLLEQRFKGIQITGAFCPPFSRFTSFDDMKLLSHLRSNKTNILWIGVGTPKQEYIMEHLMHHTHTNVIIGVGAAFDILLKIQPDAPDWIKKSGLQWFFRSLQDPGRLGKRYIKIIPSFIILMLIKWLKTKKNNQKEG